RSAEPGPSVRVVALPHRYVAGEESALVHWINGGPAKPTLTPPRPFESGVDARPTLVDNVETLAHVAQVVRWGPDWFREVGTAARSGPAWAAERSSCCHKRRAACTRRPASSTGWRARRPVSAGRAYMAWPPSPAPPPPSPAAQAATRPSSASTAGRPRSKAE